MRHCIRNSIAAVALILPVAAMAASDIAMHRDPGCGCCEKWAAQVGKQFRRKGRIIDDAQRAVFQRKVGVPAELSSCHTAIIDGMTFEGHVPVADMRRALAQRPTGVKGLAVAGMPLESPGMEAPGMRAQPYEVVSFGAGGRRVFARH